MTRGYVKDIRQSILQLEPGQDLERLSASDLMESLPALDVPNGSRLRFTIEVLNTQVDCICDPHGDCDEECLACREADSCRAG